MTTPLSPDILLRAARTWLGFQDEAPGRGATVRLMLSHVGLQPDAHWDLAFIGLVGFRCHANLEMVYSSWPLPRTGVADEMVAFARERGIAHETGAFGDLVLYWSERHKRYASSGIVEVCDEVGEADEGLYALSAIEADVTANGVRGGRGVFRVKKKVRLHERHLFIRWVDLDARGIASEPTAEVATEMGHLVRTRAVS